MSIVTDAALEFAHVLDTRLSDSTTPQAERDHLATWALEIQDAVAELDAQTP